MQQKIGIMRLSAAAACPQMPLLELGHADGSEKSYTNAHNAATDLACIEGWMMDREMCTVTFWY